jgi:hypothetical protein
MSDSSPSPIHHRQRGRGVGFGRFRGDWTPCVPHEREVQQSVLGTKLPANDEMQQDWAGRVR